MTPFPWTDLVIIIALIVLNGVFAMSELAIVSAKTSTLETRAEAGSSSARMAIRLAADPGKFLSTVQIGITLIGIIAGAYSGASLGGPVGERLALLGVPARFTSEAGFALVIAVTTYLSLIVGELVPKQLALRNAVAVAMVMARPMDLLARAAAPLVWVLDKSSALLIALFGLRNRDQETFTAEELQIIFAEATRSGVIEAEQHQILTGVVRLAERPVREMMTPRTEVDWIEADAADAEIRARIATSPHSLLLVAEGSPDNVLGVVKVRDVLAALVADGTAKVRALTRKVEVVPDQLDAMDALRVLQSADVAMALVHDEYGHFEGIVTPIDLLTAIVGNFASDQDAGDIPQIIEREDGSLLVSGALSADALSDRLGLEYGEDRDFGTAAGYALSVLRKLPVEGEVFRDQGWRFEVVDMDGRRIDKLLVSKEDESD
ncbi:hemolysin family protein [Erythrobacter sp. T5W1-R]|uniref:hemolysin family protein n=1 Tax=Erythrobacter sp. T5W1-R TaxID=3101752 RepID=UPI002AFF6A5C|nr:hemolysin family protein [Erythrobacter sp. T5W1-R]MEA1618695.1 hemolysin family protein [Erythrobacter sp. T5W1-R]